MWTSRREPRARRALLAVPLLAMLVIALAAVPSKAPAKSHRHARLPSCSHLPRSAMASLAQTGELHFLKKIGHLCEFTGKGEHHGHYHTTFDVQVIPYIKQVWDEAKSKARSLAAKNHDDFGDASKKMFFVTGELRSGGDGPCNKHDDKPGEGEAKFGPACAGEPNAVHIGVYGHGPDKHNGLDVMVTTGVTGQQGDVHLSHMLELAKRIISGKIR